MKADLIVKNIGQLVTCASYGKPKKGSEMNDVGMLKNGAVAIIDGRIAGVGTYDEIRNEFDATSFLDAENKVVTPGFVECHTHIVFAGDRINEFELRIKGASYLEIMEAGGGIVSTVEKTRKASLPELIDQSRKRLDQLLELGVTTCEVKTGYGLDTETELKMLEAIFELDKNHPIDLIPTFLPAHAFPKEFKEHPDKYVDIICNEMLPKAKAVFSSRSSAINYFADVFCEKNAFTL